MGGPLQEVSCSLCLHDFSWQIKAITVRDSQTTGMLPFSMQGGCKAFQWRTGPKPQPPSRFELTSPLADGKQDPGHKHCVLIDQVFRFLRARCSSEHIRSGHPTVPQTQYGRCCCQPPCCAGELACLDTESLGKSLAWGCTARRGRISAPAPPSWLLTSVPRLMTLDRDLRQGVGC